MELECIKFNEKMMSKEAHCRHPGDYCKFRSSCIIHFMEKENKYESSQRNKMNQEKISEQEK